MIALTVVRALHFAAAMQILGALLFVWIIDHAPDGDAGTRRLARHAMSQVAALSFAVFVLSAMAWLALQAAAIADTGVVEAWTMGGFGALLHSYAGGVWVARFAIAAALTIGLGVLFTRRDGARSMWVMGTLAFAAASLVSTAWLSHAGSDPRPERSMHLFAHASHVLGASLWLGGFGPLLLVLSMARRSAGAAFGLAHHASKWFGNVALVAVVLIVSSGVVNTIFVIDQWSDLFRGTFAVLLGGKIALMLVMLAFAALNRRRLVARLAAPGSSAAMGLLERSVGAELVLGIIVLLLASGLGITTPGVDDDQAARPALITWLSRFW